MITAESFIVLSMICYVLGVIGLVDGILMGTRVPMIVCDVIGLVFGSVTGYALYLYLIDKLSSVPVSLAILIIPIVCVVVIYRHIDFNRR